MALSGPRLAATNRTAESWWLFLAQVLVLPSLGGSFWPNLGHNKSYCRVLVALSGQIVLPSLGGSFWPNRTAESWWLFLAHVWP